MHLALIKGMDRTYARIWDYRLGLRLQQWTSLGVRDVGRLAYWHDLCLFSSGSYFMCMLH